MESTGPGSPSERGPHDRAQATPLDELQRDLALLGQKITQADLPRAIEILQRALAEGRPIDMAEAIAEVAGLTQRDIEDLRERARAEFVRRKAQAPQPTQAPPKAETSPTPPPRRRGPARPALVATIALALGLLLAGILVRESRLETDSPGADTTETSEARTSGGVGGPGLAPHEGDQGGAQPDELAPEDPGAIEQPDSEPERIFVRTLCDEDLSPLSAPSQDDPATIARRFLTEHASQFDLPDTLSTLSEPIVSSGSASHHVYFQQYHEGIPVRGGRISVHMSASGQVLVVHNDLMDVGSLPEELSVDEDQAVLAAQRALDLEPALTSEPTVSMVVFVDSESTHLAWEVGLPTLDPPHDWRILVDAVTGETLEGEDLLRSDWVTGHGRVFRPNPIQTGGKASLDQRQIELQQLQSVQLAEIDEGGELFGRYVDVRRGRAPNPGELEPYSIDPRLEVDPERVSRSDLRFHYVPGVDPEFEHVMAYYHIDRARRYIETTLKTHLALEQTVAYPHYYAKHNSYYHGVTKAIYFGDGGARPDNAQDGDVILHEYGHAVLDAQNPGLRGLEADAINEGFADYFACSLNDNPAVGEWYSGSPEGLRNIGTLIKWSAVEHLLAQASQLPVESGREQSMYDYSLAWSSALWALRKRVGKTAEADAIVLEANFFFPSRLTMHDAVQQLLYANRVLGLNHHASIISIFRESGLIRLKETLDDYGNSSDQAGLLSGDAHLGGRIGPRGDEDWFKVELRKDKVYEIKASPAGREMATRLELYFEDAKTKKIKKLEHADSRTSTAGIVWLAKETGWYYLRVTHPGGGTGEYSLFARPFTKDDHPNDATTRSSLPPGSPKSGVIQYQGDVDVFKFSVERDTKYELRATPATKSGVAISLAIVENTAPPAANAYQPATSPVPVPARSAGTRYLYVKAANEGGLGSFDVSLIVQDDHSDKKDGATVISTDGKSLPGRIDRAGDVDTFRFAAQEQRTYSIRTLKHNLEMQTALTLFDEKWKEIASSEGGSIGLVWRARKQGDYFVQVRHRTAWATTGTYQIAVASKDTDDHADRARGATRIPNGLSGSGTIDLGGDQDYFRFAVKKGHTYVVTLTDPSRSLEGHLMTDPRSILDRIVAKRPSTRTAQANGEVFVRIQARSILNPGVSPSGSYKIHVQEIPPPAPRRK